MHVASAAAEALTSYTETPPTAPSPSLKRLHTVCPSSILLSPKATRYRRLSHKLHNLQPEHPTESAAVKKNGSGDADHAALLRTDASHHDAPQEASESGSLPVVSTALSAASAIAVAPTTHGFVDSSNHSVGVSPSVSHARVGRSDANDPYGCTATHDATPFSTFTAHLRQHLALSDMGIDGDPNNKSNNTSYNKVVTWSTKPALSHTTQSFPRIKSARTRFSPNASAAAPPPSTSPTTWPTALRTYTPSLSPTSRSTTKCTDAVSGLSDAITEKTDGAAGGDQQLDALSSELTWLLQQADAVVVQLAYQHRSLQPEQLQFLAHMQCFSAGGVCVPEFHRDVLGMSAASPPERAIRSTNSSDVTHRFCAASNDSDLRYPQHRMVARPSRSVSFE